MSAGTCSDPVCSWNQREPAGDGVWLNPCTNSSFLVTCYRRMYEGRDILRLVEPGRKVSRTNPAQPPEGNVCVTQRCVLPHRWLFLHFSLSHFHLKYDTASAFFQSDVLLVKPQPYSPLLQNHSFDVSHCGVNLGPPEFSKTDDAAPSSRSAPERANPSTKTSPLVLPQQHPVNMCCYYFLFAIHFAVLTASSRDWRQNVLLLSDTILS